MNKRSLALCILVIGLLFSACGTASKQLQPTPTTPTGFQKFSNGDFSLDYPADWTAIRDESGGAKLQGAALSVLVDDVGASDTDPLFYNHTLCSRTGATPVGTSASVQLAGQSWEKLECDSPDGSIYEVLLAVKYNGKLYSLSEIGEKQFFDQDRQTLSVIEQSFAFLQ